MEQITMKFKHTEVGFLPNDWQVGRLLDYYSLKARIGWQGLTTAEYRTSGDFGLVTGTDFNDGYINWEKCVYVDKVRYIQDSNIQLRINDVLVTKDGTIGKVAFVDSLPRPTTLNSGVFVIRSISEQVDTRFLYYVLMSFYFDNFLSKISAGSTITHLYQKDFITFKLIIPTKTEQTAIATALSDMDSLISNLEKLIEKKRMIKQGVMQELLTGNNRLPGFNKKWRKSSLGETCKILKGQLITDKTRVDGSIPVIAGGKTPAYYHNRHNRIGKTITISASGASAGYISFHQNPIFASDCSTISESETYCIEFIYYVLCLMQEKIYKMQTGGAQPHIHASDIEPIEISLPEVDEQKAIAKVLSDLDIDLLNLDITNKKYSLLKQGMMQTLLTGKIRLV